MRCPKCGGYSVYTLDSRDREEYTYRRKSCIDCGYRFTTTEVIREEYTDKLNELDRTKKELKKLKTIKQLCEQVIEEANKLDTKTQG